MNKMNLNEILEKIDSFSLDDAVYVKKSNGFLDISTCYVLDPDETEDCEGENFKFSKENSLKYFLEISILIQVRDYLVNKNSEYNIEDLIDSVMYYHKHDSFK